MKRALLSILVLATPLASAQKSRPVNAFGLALQREAARLGPGRNIMTSPLALHQALGMALNGASGPTRDRLAQLMGGEGAEVASINGAAADCQKKLSAARADGSKLPLVRIANAAWDSAGFGGDGGLHFTPEFKAALASSYAAELGTLDFRDAASAETINAWAREKTFGLIPRVVSAREIQDLVFLLINTTYFEATWRVGFSLVEPGPSTKDLTKFTTAEGTEKQVAVIDKRASYGYRDTGRERTVEIPFVSPEGREFVFYAVLPNDVRAPLEPYREDAFWNDLLAQTRDSRYVEGRVTMPKFAFDFDLKMTERAELTRATGLDFLFGDSADFSAIKTPESPRAKIGLIKEITRIELDEKGVKAAAAVVVGGTRTLSIPKPPAFDVRFDRPFAFAIAEKVSGTLLFVGELYDPEAAK